MLYRFGDMHLLFDDALGKDGKLLQNGTGENAQDVIEAFKYTFSKPGNHFSPQKYHDLDIHTHRKISYFSLIPIYNQFLVATKNLHFRH